MVSEQDPPTPVALHCILVHGTFARDATWTSPDAPLAMGLRNLEPAGVQFHRFRWSGANTHVGRCAAVAELGSNLRDMADRYPSSRFLLVGHSHGGNVACAAASAIPADRCAGVVALATPFFHVRKRSLAPAAVLPAVLWVLLGASWIGYGGSWMGEIAAKGNHWLYGSWAETIGNNWLYRVYSGIVAVLTMLFIGSFLFLSAFLIYLKFKDHLAVRQDTHFRMWEQLRPTPASILSLSMTLDEAYWLHRWTRGLPEQLHRIMEWVSRHIAVGITLAALPIGIALVVAYIRESETPIFSDAVAPHALIGISWAASIAYAVVLSLWLLVRLCTYLFQRWVYGLNGVEHHLMVNVSIQRVPQILNSELVSHRNVSLPFRQYLRERFGLVHSKLYVDPRSVVEIVAWYRRRPVAGHAR